jgi:hypothetical protein
MIEQMGFESNEALEGIKLKNEDFAFLIKS